MGKPLAKCMFLCAYLCDGIDKTISRACRNNQYIGQLTLPFADAGSTFGSEGWCIM